MEFPRRFTRHRNIESPSSICYPASGTYDATLIVSNYAGSDTFTLVNFVTVYPSPTAPFVTQSNGLFTAPTGYNAYQWQLNNVTIAGATSSTYQATQAGSYTVLITDSNGCQVESGDITFTDVATTIRRAGSSTANTNIAEQRYRYLSSPEFISSGSAPATKSTVKPFSNFNPERYKY